MTFEWNGQIQSDTASHLVLTPPTLVLEVAFQSSFGSAKVVSTSFWIARNRRGPTVRQSG